MKAKHFRFYIVVFIIINSTFIFSNDYYSASGEFQFFDGNGNKTIEPTNGTISIHSLDCKIKSDSGFIYREMNIPELNITYNSIQNISLIENNKILKIQTHRNGQDAIIKIKTRESKKLLSKIKDKIKNNDAYEKSCIIKCTGSNGVFINSQKGKIILTKEDCTLAPEDGIKISGSEMKISSISFPIERVQNIEINKEKNYLSFHSCDSKVCDKYIEITSSDCNEIKDMILKFRSK